MINLTKGTVVHLTKDGTSSTVKLGKAYFGASWSESKTSVGWNPLTWIKKLFDPFEDGCDAIDVDAFLLMYNKEGYGVDTCDYTHLHSADGSLTHSGDDRKGGLAKLSDNEIITINFDKVNPQVKFIVAGLNIYSPQTFDALKNVTYRIYKGIEGKPSDVLASFSLSETAQPTSGMKSLVCGYFFRAKDGSWQFRADGSMTNEVRIPVVYKGSAKTLVKNHVE